MVEDGAGASGSSRPRSVRADALRTALAAGRTLVTGRRGPLFGGRAGRPGALLREAAASLRVVDDAAGEPIVIAEFPAVTTNPIQMLLLGRARAHGLAPVGMSSVNQLDELLELRRRGIATAVHLHWLDRVTRDARSEAEASERVEAFLRRLDGFRGAGGRVVWTVHNVLPHAMRYQALEVGLAGEVAARSDVIHVMAARTAELTAPWYDLPADRLLHVPHPSYAGVYPDHLSRLDARARLGIAPRALVLLSLGAIQPYKGLADLLDAWATLPSGERRLVVAGIAGVDPATALALDRARRDPAILVRAGKVAVPDMQVYLRAADVAVLPYRAALNSGTLLLALTFGVPVIVPADAAVADLVEPAFAITYGQAGSAGSDLAAALAAAPRLATADARAAAARAVEGVRPNEVAERFAVGLRARLVAAGT